MHVMEFGVRSSQVLRVKHYMYHLVYTVLSCQRGSIAGT